MAIKNGSALLTADELLSGKHVRTFDIDISNGKKLRLRALSGAELAAFIREEQAAKELSDGPEKTEAGFRRVAGLICELAVNDAGERLFNDSQVDEILASPTFSGQVLVEVTSQIFAANQRAGER